jgi:hypothetical protein
MPFKAYENQEQYKPIAQKTIQEDQIDRQGTLMKIADFLGIKKFGEAIGDTAYLYGTKEGRDLQAKASQGDKASIAGLKAVTDSVPTNKEIIGSAGMTAMNVLSGGLAGRAGNVVEGANALSKGAKLAKFGGTVAKGMATGYGFDVASNLEQNKGTAESFKPGMGTVLGGSLPVVGKGIKLSGNVVKHVA